MPITSVNKSTGRVITARHLLLVHSYYLQKRLLESTTAK